MFRAALRSLLLVSVLVSPAWAGSQPGVYTASSKRYGKTILSVPATYYSVKVDAAGNVSPLAGSQITVAHEETGPACHKVWTVSASFLTTGVSTVSPKPSRVSPNLCSFTVSTATFAVAYPILAEKTLEDLALRRACQQRPAGSTRILAPLPQLTGFKVLLEYAGGGVDDVRYPAPMVSITCESLALEGASAAPATLTSSGGLVKLEGTIASPALSVASVRARLTAAGKSTLVPLSLSSGTAKSGVWSGTFQAPANLGSTTMRYEVAFEATDEKSTITTLTKNPPLSFTVAALGPKAPVLPTSTAKPAPTLPH